MNKRLIALVAAVLACRLGLAQEAAPEERQAYLSKVAFDDIQALSVFNDLGISVDQATKIQAVLVASRERLQAIGQQAGQLDQANLALLQQRRASLLSGKALSDKDLQAYTAYLAQLTRFEQQREGEIRASVARVKGLLTASQRAMLDAATATPAAATPAQPQGGPQQLPDASNRQREAIYNSVVLLMRRARDQGQPRRFQELVEQECANAVRNLTGLSPDDPIGRPLVQRWVQGLVAVYNMRPIDLPRQGPEVARQLTLLTQQAIVAKEQREEQQNNQTTEPQENVVPVDPARLEAAVRYARTPELLGQVAKERNTGLVPAQPAPE